MYTVDYEYDINTIEYGEGLLDLHGNYHITTQTLIATVIHY